MATYSPQGAAAVGVSINNDRRIFNFGDRVAELAPQQSPFFTYLSRVAKKPTDDPVFKFLEQRHQWQRRTFDLKGAVGSASYTAGSTSTANWGKVDVLYDQFGRESAATFPRFLLQGQIIVVPDTNGVPRHFQINGAPDLTADTNTAAEIDTLALFTATCAFADNAKGQVVGTAFGEGTGAPEGWKDELYNREGYTQIFKTSIDLFSGTAMATRYRGRPNEFRRVWMEKLMEHKMDIENAMLFGVGRSDESASPPQRHTWGIVPYTSLYGKTYSLNYNTSDYDDFIDVADDFWHPESANTGRKLVVCSRKIMTWLNKIGDASFLKNTVGTSQFRMDIQNVKGSFGHLVTRVTTLYGDFDFVYSPLLRGAYENYAIAIDLANVAYRPLAGNGVSRDTYIETNIQTPGTDGRKDQIITEAGLEISLPETHAVITFSE